jgi:hypothetical protein
MFYTLASTLNSQLAVFIEYLSDGTHIAWNLMLLAVPTGLAVAQ